MPATKFAVKRSRHLEAETVCMTGLAIILGRRMLAVAGIAINAFGSVVHRHMRIRLAVWKKRISLTNVSVTREALSRFYRLEAVLMA